MDGATGPQVLLRVTYPILRPIYTMGVGLMASRMRVTRGRAAANVVGVAVVAVLAFPVYWMVLTALKPSTIDYGALMAGATMMALPVVIFFAIIQRHVASGLTAGAVKG